MPDLSRYSYYEPLSATEQDVVNRMIEGQDLYVEVVGWGFHPSPTITSGDKRIQVKFPMEFTKPEGLTVPVEELQLELKLRNGRTVFSDTKPAIVHGQPLMVTAGLQIDLIWDVALDAISEDARKMVLGEKKGKRVGTIKDGSFQKEQDGNDDE